MESIGIMSLLRQFIAYWMGTEGYLLKKEFRETGDKLKESKDAKAARFLKIMGDLQTNLNNAMEFIEKEGVEFLNDCKSLKDHLCSILAQLRDLFMWIINLGIRLGKWIMALFFGKAQDVRGFQCHCQANLFLLTFPRRMIPKWTHRNVEV